MLVAAIGMKPALSSLVGGEGNMDDYDSILRPVCSSSITEMIECREVNKSNSKIFG